MQGTMRDMQVQSQIMALKHKIEVLEYSLHCIRTDLSAIQAASPDDDQVTPEWIENITETEIVNWNTAYSWGNHAGVGYLTEVDWEDGFPVYDERYMNINTPLDTDKLETQYTAGENLGGERLVMISSSKAFYFDPTNEANLGKTLGLTTGAASVDTQVSVVLSGRLTSGGWGLTPNSVYYAGSGGLITTTPPSTGIVLRVGVAIDSNTLEINLSEPYILI